MVVIIKNINVQNVDKCGNVMICHNEDKPKYNIVIEVEEYLPEENVFTTVSTQVARTFNNQEEALSFQKKLLEWASFQKRLSEWIYDE